MFGAGFAQAPKAPRPGRATARKPGSPTTGIRSSIRSFEITGILKAGIGIEPVFTDLRSAIRALKSCGFPPQKHRNI
jgi:hypothetical protein